MRTENSLKKRILGLIGIAIVLAAVSTIAYAATGDVLAGFTPTNDNGNGRGIAVVGSDIFYTKTSDVGTIWKISSGGGAATSIPLSGDAATVVLGSLAWDPTIQVLWAGAYDGSGNIYKVDRITGASTLVCNVLTVNTGDTTINGNRIGYLDGLAYDPVDDRLWESDDGAGTVHQITKTCGAVSSFNTPFSNSGIAVDGAHLYLADVGAPAGNTFPGKLIHKYTKDGVELTATGLPIDTSLQGQPEGLAFDYNTFAPKVAIWAIRNGPSTSTDLIRAYEGHIEVGTIQVPEFPTVALPIASIIGLVFLFSRRKNI